MFKKILIANRGEIACRVIKTAKRYVSLVSLTHLNLILPILSLDSIFTLLQFIQTLILTVNTLT